MKQNLTKTLCLLAALAAIVACGGKNAKKNAEQATAEQTKIDSLAQVEMETKMKDADDLVNRLPEEPLFVISTNLGDMKIKLYSQTPKHRANFAKLAISGYYDGLLFHRVINNFMIQGGDPLSKDPALTAQYGTGGPNYTVPAEFVPEYRHKKGALAAARRGDAANPQKESSGSQFYIVQSEASCAQLDGAYTVFGETVEGLDVIDKIAGVETNARDLPVNPVRIISIKLDESSMPQEAFTEPLIDESAE